MGKMIVEVIAGSITVANLVVNITTTYVQPIVTSFIVEGYWYYALP